jgi:hypothetical protein
MRASRFYMLRKVLIPSIVPWIFASLRVGIGLALVGAVIGELLGANRGLGWYVEYSAGRVDINGVFTGLVVLGVLGMALNGSTRGNGEIETVTSPERRLNAPAVTLVFSPQASMATVNTMLAHQGLSIVSGPGRSGNYKAELSPDAVASGATADSVAAVISKDPNVVLAQPIAR